MKQLPDPRSNDTPQINLILDQGIKGVKPFTVKPDSNRTDPLAGFIYAMSRGILLPHGVIDASFQLLTLFAAGGVVLVLLSSCPYLMVRLAIGLILLTLSGVSIIAVLSLPELKPHATIKAIAFGLGGLIIQHL